MNKNALFMWPGNKLGSGHFHLVFQQGTQPTQRTQPTGSQIKGICMGIYCKIDKTVEMHINSH